jgi:hypothetical protein
VVLVDERPEWRGQQVARAPEPVDAHARVHILPEQGQLNDADQREHNAQSD